MSQNGYCDCSTRTRIGIFAALLSRSARDIASCKDEVEAMRLLRRMKSEAALLIALADIGGVWPVMRAARALTDLADTAVDAAVRFCLADAARAGRLVPKDQANSSSRKRLYRAGDGQDGGL